jgi:16S rRNA (adenine1518-N6/adenine1519-N6)-dimethyltransferase
MMRAKKEMGQHFLVQESIAERLATSLPLEGCDAIVEVGPGKGILTKFLLQLSLPVVAVELDRDLIPFLEKEFHSPGFRLVQGDILRVRLDELFKPETSFLFAGNFPYNISSQIIFLALQYRHQVPIVAGMFQREMAVRICSGPGSKDFGVISVIAQAYYKAEILFQVKPGSFSPPPKVQSAVIRLTRYRKEIEGVDFNTFRRVVKLAFSQRRKKLRNTVGTLIDESILKEMNVVDLRPEQLSVEQFIELAKCTPVHPE